MRTEWSRTKSRGGPSIQPVYTYALVILSLMATLGIQGFRYMRVWTPLERDYLPASLGSQLAGIVRGNGSYTLLQVVTRKGSPVALDSDVVPAMSNIGENTLALTEEAVKHGALRLERHRAHYNNAEMHAYLGNLIYQNQTLMDLVRPALWGGLVIFFVGLLPATYLDHRRSLGLRFGLKKGPELMTVAQFNRKRRSGARGLVTGLRSMLEWVLGLNKQPRVPLGKDNPRVSIAKEALPQESSEIAPVAALIDVEPQPSDMTRKITPAEPTPSQEPELEHAVTPIERRFFE